MKEFLNDLFIWFYPNFINLELNTKEIIFFVSSVLFFGFIGFFLYKNLIKRGKK